MSTQAPQPESAESLSAVTAVPSPSPDPAYRRLPGVPETLASAAGAGDDGDAFRTRFASQSGSVSGPTAGAGNGGVSRPLATRIVAVAMGATLVGAGGLAAATAFASNGTASRQGPGGLGQGGFGQGNFGQGAVGGQAGTSTQSGTGGVPSDAPLSQTGTSSVPNGTGGIPNGNTGANG